ncbi:ABC1 kinase family protein [Acidocella aminolytica]|jgi:predicted unusual protein kinase regulating ubiquinone biosynthesis (AarF/ABC1/UbiB family)|uniref:ABC transporter n=1 Tax=Acidocella aminolytica 101 = DSM 11237 TaxID=1120923 RepID=A0A0D6PL18_9PROT|nr:AarF/ABC1/UbiB kinase family protein [Acidocella aminolytica]GAN82091.1 ABC transporter [Acidocella aminolytica 101 = DSM 11237]GBQ35631.1 ABC transporter ATP-binding protein [Acidocella aminolytica 101 = DSM 11237]SHE75053.1 Predicted unusual protein kinase regulating ubiquinone biosynthesis, AarF/ABC1/UbiB family [Acidocella aminolytica 101 = DSM 11237]
MSERGSNLFGEVRRMARTSGAVGGIAARIAGERVFGIKTDQARHAEDLKSLLGGLKGPMMKVAQFLSTVPDALPPEYAKQLAELQSNAPPMGWPFVRRRMAGELGADWESKFKSFTREAVAAASLGQVHRAVLPDGRDVAVKLQYPDMPSVIEADLRQVKMAMAVYKRMDNAIIQDDIYVELSERFREELDYQREAAQMRLYRQMLADVPNVNVPEPIEGYTTTRLLTMSWLKGQGFRSWMEGNPSQEQRNALATALFRAWYIPFYRYGVIHGDPHLGNYQVSEVGGLNLLDYGCIRVFPAQFVGGVLELYKAVQESNESRARHAYDIWGFKGITDEQVEVLNEWARFLYKPLIEDRVRPIQEGQGTEFGREVAQKVHAGLQRTGGVRPPREFVLMDRSAIGLGAVFLRLGAELNWCRLFQETVAGFDQAALAARQQEALNIAGVPEAK